MNRELLHFKSAEYILLKGRTVLLTVLGVVVSYAPLKAYDNVAKASVVTSVAEKGLMISGKLKRATVTGTVTDENGVGLPGVTVVVKGTTQGTATDINGSFTLPEVEDGAVLVFSFIGYETQEVPVNGRSSVDVTLAPDVKALEEVVVVGYGTQRKSDITGSVAVVEPEEMKKYATNDVSQLLQGRASGVNVTSDGQPGAAPNVRIRGITTFGDNTPLYVVDGVPVATGVRDFNPNDIESIQVLKDASAGAIYGSRAANGVIIITTKRGKKNTPLQVNYSGYYGIDKVWQRIPVTNRVQYQMLNNESQLNGGAAIAPANDPNSPLFIDDIDTDWQEEAFKTGTRQNHTINFSGGGENTSYNVSLDYFGNDGVLKGNGPTYDRYTVRANTNGQKGIFSFGESMFYTHSHENSLTYNTTALTGGRPPLVIDMLLAIPTMGVYDPNREGGFAGTTNGVEEAIVLNVVGANSLLENWVDVDRTFANAWGQLDLINKNGHSLKYKLNLSYDRTLTRDYSFQPEFDLGYFFRQSTARLDDNTRIYSMGLVENTLNYEKTFDKHSLAVLIGQMYQVNSYNIRYGHAEGFSKPYYPVLANGRSQTVGSYDTENTIASFLGRVNYSYDDRYLITATMRRDGSSRFAPTNRFGYFPSVALGWKLSNEKFLNLPDAISDLKLRGSYGSLGNQNIGDYLYTPYLNSNILYNFGGQVVAGGLQTNLVSQDIKWETRTTANIGLDAALLNGMFDFTAEYYSSKSTDILVGVPIPSSTGSVNTAPIVNSGSLRNSGFEFTATYHKTEGEFTFDISANGTTVKNKVLALGGNNEPIYGTGSRTEVGREIGEHYGYVTEGIFQSEDEIANHAFQSAATSPGDLIFKDLNEDGVINAEDRTYLGSAIPDFTYGLNFSAAYKNFDLTIFGSGATGYLINSRQYRSLMHTSDYMNYHEDALDRWTPTNTNTDVPRLVAGDPNDNGRDSDREGWLQSGNYLRINTVSLGYNLPTGLIKHINNVRVYATAQNLYTFQAYKGYNPDFTSGVFNPGYDNGSYPRPRTFMLGVQVGF
ncbi:SusC/RagA family TonB-linked outer membrane protein [Pontibacter silvestris]|uniref:SusC/RagA family TonB-linked outer membrane protein n=1 Tax=Pontibacter silvestris TaxID=2305183 RepID=A0ABW4X456_9BACT|nr:TonB-dependent receptor [Pontibacter silvestris]MCC9134896.1 TonB-dependent receptor [Pontibacter silvestris]